MSATHEAVEPNQAESGPLRHRECRVVVECARGREQEEDGGEGDAERHRAHVRRELAPIGSLGPPARPDL
jgi:hypothetical protein